MGAERKGRHANPHAVICAARRSKAAWPHYMPTVPRPCPSSRRPDMDTNWRAAHTCSGERRSAACQSDEGGREPSCDKAPLSWAPLCAAGRCLLRPLHPCLSHLRCSSTGSVDAAGAPTSAKLFDDRVKQGPDHLQTVLLFEGAKAKHDLAHRLEIT